MKINAISEDEYLTFDEAERLLRAAAPEWRALIVVGLKTGLRVGELLALKWQDVDLVTGRSSSAAPCGRGRRVHPRAEGLAPYPCPTRLWQPSRRTAT